MLAQDNHFLQKLNFDSLIEKMENLIKIWKKRKLTLNGRILIIKTLLVSQLIYKFSVLPTPSINQMKKIDHLLTEYLWNDKKHFINKNIIIGQPCDGGLNMVDIYAKEIAMKCRWVQRITLSNNFQNLLKGLVEYFIPESGRLFWSGNLTVKDGLNLMLHRSMFWECVVRSWCI